LTVLTNNYAKIPQLERDIIKKKGDLDDANIRDDSNQQSLVEIEIKEKELALEEEKQKLKSLTSDLLAELQSKQKEYQLAEVSLKDALKTYEWNKQKYELGVISKIELASSEIAYLEALNNKKAAGYAYFLDQLSVSLAEQGILMGSDKTE